MHTIVSLYECISVCLKRIPFLIPAISYICSSYIEWLFVLLEGEYLTNDDSWGQVILDKEG